MLLYTIWGMTWLESPKRVAASSDMPGRGACILRTQDYLMGLPIFGCSVRSGNPPN